MNISGLVIFLIVASLIGRILKSAQLNQAKRNKQDEQNPQIPYEDNQSQASSAHESAAKPRAWKGIDAFREMLEKLEVAGSQQQDRMDPSVNFSQAFEEQQRITPRPKTVQELKTAPIEGVTSIQGLASAQGVYSTQGMASSEGTFSTQGKASAEGIYSTQGMASSEGFGMTEGVMRSRSRSSSVMTAAAALRPKNGYFSNTQELKRAVIMSEVLGKPVSMRKKRMV